MKLSAILSAKSELANEIENNIEYLTNDVKSNKEMYADSDMPEWVIQENEKLSLKIKYYESILKSIPELK